MTTPIKRTKRAPVCAKTVSLLPCPFCGSPGYVGLWIMSMYWSVGCERGACPVEFPNLFETKGKAISFWNGRSPEPVRARSPRAQGNPVAADEITTIDAKAKGGKSARLTS